MNTLTSIDLVQLLSTTLLCGLIWTVQLVHYPAFRFIREDQFPDFHRFHSFRIALIVIPFMLMEVASAVWLTLHGGSLSHHLQLSVLLVTAGIWASTFLIQVPMHHRLSRGPDASLGRRLTVSNWIRTALWSLKSALLWTAYAAV